MPVVRGLSVSVHTENGPLTEYGTKRIGSGSIISSFVQSEDNTPFWINFSPSNPFDFKTTLDSKRARYAANTKHQGWGNVSGSWDFSAHIFIDDNPKSDKNLIVDLPRNGKGYDPVVTARGRSCVDQQGVSGEQGWVFKEVGIENYFRRLTTNEKAEGEDDEWEMVSEDGSANNTTNMGQIKIQLFRVRQRGMDKTRKPDRLSEGPPQQQQTSSDVEISHTVSVGKPKPRLFHYVTVDYLDGPKDPWATIIFMYRGKKQLQKMGFTTGTGPARRNSCGIFEPGSLRSLNGNLNSGNSNILVFRDDAVFNDQDTPTKKRGHTSSASVILKKPPPGLGEGGGSSHLKLKDPIVFEPKTTAHASSPSPRIFLKRKPPPQQSDITTSLSAMSLDTKEKLWPLRAAGGSDPGQTSPKRKSIDDDCIPEAALACPKKVKVEEAGNEELL